MRNPLRSLVARPANKPTLRERFAATREKYGRTLRVHRAVNAPTVEAPSAVERPAVPHGWPDLDAALVTAAGDLVKIDEALAVLLKGETRDADEVPGHSALESERTEILDTLAMEKARTLGGLQAKARALLSRDVVADPSWTSEISASLARDIIGADSRAMEPRPDPIFALIEEARRLNVEWSRLFAVSRDRPEGGADAVATDEAHAAMWEHVRSVLLKTVPATAAGCVALARFASEFTKEQGVPLEYESNDPVLDLIARSPAL